MLMPEGQTILPFTKTTWEGTGVEADVAVHANDALRAAHLKAIRSLIEQTPDQTHKTALQDILKKLEPSNSAIMKLSSQGFADAPHGLYALPPTSWALVKELFKTAFSNSLTQAVNEDWRRNVLSMPLRGPTAGLLRGINCVRLVRRRDKSLQWLRILSHLIETEMNKAAYNGVG